MGDRRRLLLLVRLCALVCASAIALPRDLCATDMRGPPTDPIHAHTSQDQHAHLTGHVLTFEADRHHTVILLVTSPRSLQIVSWEMRFQPQELRYFQFWPGASDAKPQPIQPDRWRQRLQTIASNVETEDQTMSTTCRIASENNQTSPRKRIQKFCKRLYIIWIG